MTRACWCFIVSAGLLAASPLIPRASQAPADHAGFPGWPTQLEGHALTRLPLEEREVRAARAMPGLVARFTDGNREVIYRWVTAPSRVIHASQECLRGSGYAVVDQAVYADMDGQRWRRFHATRGTTQLMVRESIVDAQGRSFDDVSEWYWEAMLGRSTGPWWMVTVSQQLQ